MQAGVFEQKVGGLDAYTENSPLTFRPANRKNKKPDRFAPAGLLFTTIYPSAA